MTQDHFQILREDISTLKNEITARLDRLNGKVGHHESKIAILETRSHTPNSCTVVDGLIKDVHELKTNSLANKRIWQVAFAAAGLMAAAATVLVEMFRH